MLFKDRPAAKKNADVYYVYGLDLRQDRPAQAGRAGLRAGGPAQARLRQRARSTSASTSSPNKQYAARSRPTRRSPARSASTDATTYTDLGDAYRGHSADYDPSSGDRNQLLREAETAYKRAIHRDRNFGPAYYDLGVLYLDADDFPASGGGTVDKLVRLNRAKTYFDQYKDMPGVDMNLYDERAKDVRQAIKREEKARKRKAKAKGGG